ncbi:linear gramicidin synthetase subunit D domain protein [Mycobacterium xenopi 4042]|uniref:Linear gramicidin synthetase subunit D domain protein n=1 Tax=Mycobacterium xenopi 4042 TaxID=1299334 RepID=X8E6F9_MYCXE|nr:linear gramicidin synthetase subunit D domain protein [Mycobacterium xenopi 4042]
MRPRDVFVEQTVERLARVAEVVTDDAQGPVDEGIGPWRRLQSCDGCNVWTARLRSSTRPWWCKLPPGHRRRFVALLQALLDRHGMLRLRVGEDWSLMVPEPGSVDARDCLHVTDALSDEALMAARASLNPADG